MTVFLVPRTIPQLLSISKQGEHTQNLKFGFPDVLVVGYGYQEKI